MVANFSRNLRQTATYWTPGVNDGAGGKTYGTPTLILCRWQDVAELFINAQGEQVTSSAVVYPDRPLENSGYLALGDFSSESQPSAVAGVREIRSIGSSPSLDNRMVLNKVWL